MPSFTKLFKIRTVLAVWLSEITSMGSAPITSEVRSAKIAASHLSQLEEVKAIAAMQKETIEKASVFMVYVLGVCETSSKIKFKIQSFENYFYTQLFRIANITRPVFDLIDSF